MLIGGVVNVLGMALLPFTEFVPRAVQALWPLLVQVVSSAGWSLFVVSQVAGLVAFTTAENRKNAYAVREAMAGLGMFLGALIGGMLPGLFASLLNVTTDQPTPYRYGLWVSVLLGMAALIPAAMVAPIPRITRVRGAPTRFPPLLPLAILAAAGFLNNGAVASCKAFYSAYMDKVFGLPASVIGIFSSLGQLLAVFAALSSPRLARKQGGQAMLIASLGLGGSLLLAALVPHWSAAGLGAIGTLALSAMWVPTYQALQMEMADPEWRSLVAGAGSMAMSFGFGAVSFGGGYIVAALGYRRLFLLGAGLASLSAALMWSMLYRRQARQSIVETR